MLSVYGGVPPVITTLMEEDLPAQIALLPVRLSTAFEGGVGWVMAIGPRV